MEGFSLAMFEVPVVILILVSAVVLLVSENWRLSILALALQYVGVFVLVTIAWPLNMALVKLVTGWIAGAVLAMALRSVPASAPGPRQIAFEWHLGRFNLVFLRLSGELFRLLAAAMVVLVVISVASRTAGWVPGITPQQATGSLFLIGLGLLHLGLTAHPLRVVLGLLTILSGFEIIYAAVEFSTLVAGLLAGVNLSLALVGAFLLTAPLSEAEG
jgi:hypothetical protein